MAWLFYALLAPLLFGAVNILDKLLRDRHLGTFTLTVVSGITLAWASVLLLFVDFSVSPNVLIAGLAVGVMFFSGGFPYFHALSVEEASRVVPLWALEAPMVLLLSFAFLRERLSGSDYLGFFMVVSGTFLVSTKRLHILEVLRPSKAFLLMLGATGLAASGIVVSKSLYSEASFWEVQILIGLGATIAVVVSLTATRKWSVLNKDILSLKRSAAVQLALRQVLLVAAVLSVNFAIFLGSASLTSALAQLAAVFVFPVATLLSIMYPHVLSEVVNGKVLLTKAASISVVVLGVFLINT